jgi:hypothetical protein
VARTDSGDETFQAHERDRLLLDIYGQLGETEKQTAVSWRIFKRFRSKESLQKLLDVIGAGHRDAVLAGEIATILAENALSLSDAAFLIEAGRMDETVCFNFVGDSIRK